MKEQLTDCIRTFFHDFAMSVIDGQLGDKNHPKYVKQAMLEHYEEIFPLFAQKMPFQLMHITFPDAETAERELRDTFIGKQPTPMELLHFACRTETTYQQMVEEYRRCFSLLLRGIIP